jgi:multiple sugar transport system permease protein
VRHPPIGPLARAERRLGFLLLLPAFALLAGVVLYPIGTLLWTSTQQLHLAQPWLEGFVGLENYRRALADGRFWSSLGNTALYVVITVPGAVVAGLALAMLADLPFRVKWPVRLGLLLPWALPLVFAGLIFRWFFEYEQGLVNALLRGLGAEPLRWLSTPILAFIATSLAIIWKSSSFVALVLLAGLQAIPASLYEAAEVDGASFWQKFWRITLPMLIPALVVATIFRTITAIQTFDIPYAMTGGGPGHATETLAMYVHRTTIDVLDFGYGSALAALMFLISLGVTSVYIGHIRRDAGSGG